MSNQPTQENKVMFTTPVGRWVSGSITEGEEKNDRTGQPYVYKSGQHAGKQYAKFSVGIAFPKGDEVNQPYGANNWMMTAWGQQLTAVGTRFRANAMQDPEFAWKVKDGDDNVKIGKKSGKTNSQLTGWAGHWVVWFSANQVLPAIQACPLWTLLDDNRPGQFLPQPKPLEVSRIKRGDFVQVSVTVTPNNEVDNPGIFVGMNMLCLIGYGEAIIGGPDVATANFGQGISLPAGASFTPTALPPTSAPAAPALPGTPATAGSSAPPLPSAPPTPQAPVPPNQAFANPPPVPTPPAPPTPPAGPVMTDKARAENLTYDILKGGGWTDEQMKQHGYMA